MFEPKRVKFEDEINLNAAPCVAGSRRSGRGLWRKPHTQHRVATHAATPARIKAPVLEPRFWEVWEEEVASGQPRARKCTGSKHCFTR
jgi:hypothetical protein